MLQGTGSLPWPITAKTIHSKTIHRGFGKCRLKSSAERPSSVMRTTAVAALRVPPPPARLAGLGAVTSSTKEFHAPQFGHFPAQRAET